GQRALEGRRGLGRVPERELAAGDPERQLGPDVEELVERAVRLRGRRPLEPLEDRERLRGAAVAQNVPRVLEVDDVGEVAVGVVATQALEGLAGGRETVVLEEAPRGEVLVDVAEPLAAVLRQTREVLRRVRGALRITIELVRERRIRGDRVLHGREHPAEGPHRLHRRSEEHTSELQSLAYLVCRLLLE